MIAVFRYCERRLVAVERMAIFILLCLLIVILFIQVVFRFVLNQPLDFTEEASRLLFAWLVYIGAAHALYTSQHFVVDFVYNLVPPRPAAVIGYLIDAVAIGFIAYLAWHGFRGALGGTGQILPVLQISAAAQSLALPVGLSLMAVHALSCVLCGRHIGAETADPMSE